MVHPFNFDMAEHRKAKYQPLEIGNQAVWSVSSCKPGYGVSQLRDGSTETYWQSDGLQPHFINIEFMRKMAVKQIAVFTDYRQDESYTPSKIAIRAGSHFHDLQEPMGFGRSHGLLDQLSVRELDEPQDWVEIDAVDKDGKPVRAFLFQIAILTNHQNGRDTHIRQVKIFEPESKPSEQASIHTEGPVVKDFETIEFRAMRICR